MTILACHSVREQAPVKVANQAATKFSQVVSIAPASAARISVTVADQAGQQQTKQAA